MNRTLSTAADPVVCGVGAAPEAAPAAAPPPPAGADPSAVALLQHLAALIGGGAPDFSSVWGFVEQ